jgi:hypothetical protein
MFTPDFLGGSTLFEVVRATQVAAAGATSSAAAISLNNLTGKVLVIADVGPLASATVSIQLFSNTTNAVTGGVAFGSAFATVAGVAAVQVDLEAFPAPFLYATVTIGGTVTTVAFSVVALGSKKLS